MTMLGLQRVQLTRTGRKDEKRWTRDAQIKNVSPDGEAKGREDRRTRLCEQHTVRVYALRRIFKRVRGKLLPILDRGLVLK
jgi:hypothetical protein